MDIPRRHGVSRWDGYPIYLTKDCSGCAYYRELEKTKLCGEGIAWKELVANGSPVRCAKLKNTRERRHSIEFLDQYIATYGRTENAASSK